VIREKGGFFKVVAPIQQQQKTHHPLLLILSFVKLPFQTISFINQQHFNQPILLDLISAKNKKQPPPHNSCHYRQQPQRVQINHINNHQPYR
jgi:hypothetical protein